MKVMQINCVYGKGSTGKIVMDIHNVLVEIGIESVVCYGRGQKPEGNGVYKTCSEPYSKLNNLLSRISGIMYGGCLISTAKLIRIIKRERPDIVHLHCINGYFVNIYRLIKWLKRNHIKTVLTLHAEFMYTGSCGYALDCNCWRESGCVSCPRWKSETGSWFFNRTRRAWKKMRDAFSGFDNNLAVVSVSPWLCERAEQSAILRDKRHRVVLNGLDDSVFRYKDAQEERKLLSLDDGKVIFHATPYFDLSEGNIKGGRHVVELAHRLHGSNVKIVVAGDYDKAVEFPDNMIMLGRVSDQKKLASLYSIADITLLTSERETFSMVVAESLNCGTPVVGFEAGAPETIAIDGYCVFVKYADADALAAAVTDFLYERKFDKSEISRMASEKYSKRKMSDAYMEIYENLIGNTQ